MYPGSTIVSGCGVCEKLCVELTFSEPREFMSWAMMNGFALEKDSFLTEVYFDAQKGRAGTTTILKCTKCGQHFSTTVGKAGPLIPWKPLDQPPVSDPNAVAVAVTTPPTAIDLLAFAEQLKDRQGTVMPDFDAIRRRKAELDRDLLGDDPHDRP